jgi:hypothetical protein
MTRKICDFQDPVHGIPLALWEIDYMELKNSPFQRVESTNLRNKLAQSINVGFFVPLLIVFKDGVPLIVDGQHRYHAFMRAKGAFPILCIEIPERFMYNALIYNIEASDKIKDTCTKVHSMYNHFVIETPEKSEKTLAEYLLDTPYYISLAFAYVDYELSSPSLVETVVKKFDGWIDAPLPVAAEERQRRGQAIAKLEATVNEVAARDGIGGSGAFQLKSAIVSKSSGALWGRKRNVGEDFHYALGMLTEHILISDWSFLGS